MTDAEVEAPILWPSDAKRQLTERDPDLDCKAIQPVHSEGGQPSDFFGRNNAKAETPILWPPDAKN